jgi:hypothetical protein
MPSKIQTTDFYQEKKKNRRRRRKKKEKRKKKKKRRVCYTTTSYILSVGECVYMCSSFHFLSAPALSSKTRANERTNKRMKH